ncbi:NUDIX hydrolase [Mycobacterium hackensackense]|uniref:NUDIX domain-containing protein n=1 Tax=Mycobacterium hackensackense TaxID=228909 RepID=UPI002265C99C|nr:NUDIX hydrolase [Mycobacterium hackensackense]MCV7253398.1 NUDIX hydrolase [Mycobacterium hackensackense]
MSGNLPLRRSCRGLLANGEQILLAQHSIGDGRTVWVGPGGGVEDDETLTETLARELHEETGLVLTGAHIPRLVWIQTAEFREMSEQGYAGVVNYYFLLHVDIFEPASGLAAGEAGHPDGEGILHQRWWSLTEIVYAHAHGELFSPRALPTLIRAVLDGPPTAPIAIGL